MAMIVGSASWAGIYRQYCSGLLDALNLETYYLDNQSFERVWARILSAISGLVGVHLAAKGIVDRSGNEDRSPFLDLIK